MYTASMLYLSCCMLEMTLEVITGPYILSSLDKLGRGGGTISACPFSHLATKHGQCHDHCCRRVTVANCIAKFQGISAFPGVAVYVFIQPSVCTMMKALLWGQAKYCKYPVITRFSFLVLVFLGLLNNSVACMAKFWYFPLSLMLAMFPFEV